VESQEKVRTVSLVVRLTENEQPLVGSRAWVAKVIEESTLELTTTTKGSPCLCLCHPTGFGPKGRELKTHVVAIFADHGDCGSPYGDSSAPFVDCFPFWWAGSQGAVELFDQPLTKAGCHLAADFGRKCRTLLRLRLRKNDKPAKAKLKVSLTNV